MDRRLLFFQIGLIVSLLSLPENSLQASPSLKKAKNFVEKVCLGTEYGSGTGFCRRWRNSPSLSVFNATVEEQQLVQQVVKELNSALRNTKIKIELFSPNNTNASIKVYFAPLNTFSQLARKHRFQYISGNWGYVWTFWNRRCEITEAIVLLANDKLKKQQKYHYALEEIAQSLGLSNDSKEFEASVFYQKGSDGGKATSLSKVDLQLIEFFYLHINPGDTNFDIKLAFERYWPKKKSAKKIAKKETDVGVFEEQEELNFQPSYSSSLHHQKY